MRSWLWLSTHGPALPPTAQSETGRNSSPAEDDHDSIIGDHLARPEVQVLVIKYADVHHVRLANFSQQIRNDVVEPIFADLDAIAMANALDLERTHAVDPRGNFERR